MTINYWIIDGVLWTWIQGCRTEGIHESTELWRFSYWNDYLNKFFCSANNNQNSRDLRIGSNTNISLPCPKLKECNMSFNLIFGIIGTWKLLPPIPHAWSFLATLHPWLQWPLEPGKAHDIWILRKDDCNGRFCSWPEKGNFCTEKRQNFINIDSPFNNISLLL